MARPKSGEAMVTIAVRVPTDAAEQITARADKAGQSRAVWVRDALLAALGLGKNAGSKVGAVTSVRKTRPAEHGELPEDKPAHHSSRDSSPVPASRYRADPRTCSHVGYIVSGDKGGSLCTRCGRKGK